MDALKTFVAVPTWAYDFCYYYFAVAVVVIVYTLYTLFRIFMQPGLLQKNTPVMLAVTALIISGIVTTVLTMMQFWICRSALKPTETFAVNCATNSECMAVMGTPQGADCTCGGRGFCGGCLMRNNVEPSMISDSDLASFKTEGFVSGSDLCPPGKKMVDGECI